jgi:repressor LexA
MRGLTARQETVVAFIQRHVRRHGKAPTYREIARHIGRDVRAAYQHVQALERKGVLERRDHGIRLLGDYDPPRGIPVLGRVAAGAPILAVENIEEHVELFDDIERELQGGGGGPGETGDLFMLRVRGDSMIDAGISDGDLVLVRAQREDSDGEIAAVVIGEEATVKRVRLGPNSLRLEPANESYRPIIVGPEDDVRIAGKVIMSIRRF